MLNCIKLGDLSPSQVVACLIAKGLKDTGDYADNLLALREHATENGWRKDDNSGEFLINPRGLRNFPTDERVDQSATLNQSSQSSDQVQSTRPVASAPNPPSTAVTARFPASGLQSGLDTQQGLPSFSQAPFSTTVTRSTATGPTAGAFSANEHQRPRSLPSETRFATPDSFGQERFSERQVPLGEFPRPPPQEIFQDYTFAHQRSSIKRLDPSALMKQATNIAKLASLDSRKIETLVQDVNEHSERFRWSDSNCSDIIFTKIPAEFRKDVGITTADSFSAICEKLRSMTDSFSDAQYEFRSFRLKALVKSFWSVGQFVVSFFYPNLRDILF